MHLAWLLAATVVALSWGLGSEVMTCTHVLCAVPCVFVLDVYACIASDGHVHIYPHGGEDARSMVHYSSRNCSSAIHACKGDQSNIPVAGVWYSCCIKLLASHGGMLLLAPAAVSQCLLVNPMESARAREEKTRQRIQNTVAAR